MLSITSLLGNGQRLDGGAMFGNVPRELWSRWCVPDDRGRIELACRSFLVEDGERRILLETGVGAFFEPKLRVRYGVSEERHRLLDALAERGLAPEDIDWIVLSHLHFDHAGGLLEAFRDGAPPSLAFPRARFVVGQRALDRARAPHPRDRASFVPELLPLLEASGRLVVAPDGTDRVVPLGDRVRLRFSDGHTPGMRLAVLEGKEARAVFAADLVPGVPWVHLPITMGYDRAPELLIDEKRALYEELGPGTWLLFTHDPAVAAARLVERSGRYETRDPRAELSSFDLDGPEAA